MSWLELSIVPVLFSVVMATIIWQERTRAELLHRAAMKEVISSRRDTLARTEKASAAFRRDRMRGFVHTHDGVQ